MSPNCARVSCGVVSRLPWPRVRGVPAQVPTRPGILRASRPATHSTLCCGHGFSRDVADVRKGPWVACGWAAGAPSPPQAALSGWFPQDSSSLLSAKNFLVKK